MNITYFYNIVVGVVKVVGVVQVFESVVVGDVVQVVGVVTVVDVVKVLRQSCVSLLWLSENQIFNNHSGLM